MHRIYAALGLLLLSALAPAHAEDRGLTAGLYDGLLLGFDPATRRVTGYFNEETGRGQFSCIFYLAGKLEASEASITTYYPETPKDDVIRGRLRLVAPHAVQVSLPTEHGGCWNVQHFADKEQPASFTLDAAHPWISVAVVESTKAFLYDAPELKTHRKSYLVQGDGLGVRSIRPGWLQVDFASGEKSTSGWVRQSDVYPAA